MLTGLLIQTLQKVQSEARGWLMPACYHREAEVRSTRPIKYDIHESMNRASWLYHACAQNVSTPNNQSNLYFFFLEIYSYVILEVGFSTGSLTEQLR
jgi:hypothetical protein